MFIINARIRKEKGKSISRKLRKNNKLPAVIYGGKATPIIIELDHDRIWNMQNKIEFYSEFVNIKFNDKEEERVKIKSIQRHAFRPKIIHIDFIRT